MAIILAAATGLWTDPATWIGGVVPGVGDVAVANGKVITIDASVTVQEIRNDTTGGATAGGGFPAANGVTLNGNVYAGDSAVAIQCFRLSGTNSATINGTVYGNNYGPGSTGIAAGTYGAVNAGTGTLRVRATVQGSRGMPAVSGPMQFIDAAHASAKVRATAGLTEITLRAVDAVVPTPGDVRLGVSYAGKTGAATRTGTQDMGSHFSATETEPYLELLLDDDGTALLTDDDLALEF
jgi:hypothetical protein